MSILSLLDLVNDKINFSRLTMENSQYTPDMELYNYNYRLTEISTAYAAAGVINYWARRCGIIHRFNKLYFYN